MKSPRLGPPGFRGGESRGQIQDMQCIGSGDHWRPPTLRVSTAAATAHPPEARRCRRASRVAGAPPEEALATSWAGSAAALARERASRLRPPEVSLLDVLNIAPCCTDYDLRFVGGKARLLGDCLRGTALENWLLSAAWAILRSRWDSVRNIRARQQHCHCAWSCTHCMVLGA